MKSSFKVGRLFGIPLAVNLSWFISLGLVIGALALRVYPNLFPDSETWTHVVLAVVSAGLFFVSIILHELAHGLIARRYGIPVKEITLFVLGGLARIPREAPRPFAEFLMAGVGPLVSLLLSGAFFLLWLATGLDDGPLATMWEWLWIMNVVLALFNLIPGLPLDGGRVLRAILWGITGDYQKATRISTIGGNLTAYAMMIGGALIVLGPNDWVFGLSPFNGIWLILLGMFLKVSAHQSYFQMRVTKVLQEYRVGDNMSWDLPTVPDTANVEDTLRWFGERRLYLFVSKGGTIVGVVDGRLLTAVPQGARATTTVADVMIPASAVVTMQPDNNMAEVLQNMEMEDTFELPVVQEGRVIGHVGRDSFIPIFARHPELVRG